MKVRLVRIQSDHRGVLGLLYVDGQAVCHTLERPWVDNKRNVSCIPAGTYPVRKRFSPKFQRELYEVRDVPDRTHIMFHAGNWITNSLGCIMPGRTSEGFGDPGLKNLSVGSSSIALKGIHDLLDGCGEPIELEVTDV